MIHGFLWLLTLVLIRCAAMNSMDCWQFIVDIFPWNFHFEKWKTWKVGRIYALIKDFWKNLIHRSMKSESFSLKINPWKLNEGKQMNTLECTQNLLLLSISLLLSGRCVNAEFQDWCCCSLPYLFLARSALSIGRTWLRYWAMKSVFWGFLGLFLIENHE